MGRRKGFWASMAQAAREAERERLAAEKAQVRAIKAREQAQRASLRADAASEREAKRLYAEARQHEAVALAAELDLRRKDLESILEATLAVDDYIDLDSLKDPLSLPEFRAGPLGTPLPAPDRAAYVVPQLTFAQRLVPGAKARYAAEVSATEERLRSDFVSWEAAERERHRQLADAKAAHERELQEVRQRTAVQHAEVDAIKAELDAGDPATVKDYFEMVLQRSSWPDGFPQQFVIARDPKSKLLAIDYILPDWSVVPEARAYRYVKARDEIETTPEAATKRRSLYTSVVAQSALRILHEVFEADRRSQVETVALNCMVDTIDRATGTRHVPCIASVRTTAHVFASINLAAVDPATCLKGLSASVSPNPAELAPVRPVLELRMVDPRFITEADVLSALDQRPNLMDLTPGEFESLITNLFTRMGLEARQTQASRDGGVDCVAFDPRPIFGGKVVIQAKRYKNTVGVSAVRDLFGTMQNEGASKGILVTTSGYGPAAFQFAEGKPMELLSGANLLYLLAEHAGLEARIVVPETWVDPVADAPERS